MTVDGHRVQKVREQIGSLVKLSEYPFHTFLPFSVRLYLPLLILPLALTVPLPHNMRHLTAPEATEA